MPRSKKTTKYGGKKIVHKSVKAAKKYSKQQKKGRK
jgi:hypothetical protein